MAPCRNCLLATSCLSTDPNCLSAAPCLPAFHSCLSAAACLTVAPSCLSAAPCLSAHNSPCLSAAALSRKPTCLSAKTPSPPPKHNDDPRIATMIRILQRSYHQRQEWQQRPTVFGLTMKILRFIFLAFVATAFAYVPRRVHTRDLPRHWNRANETLRTGFTLNGAEHQMAQGNQTTSEAPSASETFEQLKQHLITKMEEYNVPTLLALSVASLTMSIILSIVAIARMPRATKGFNFVVASLAAQITSLLCMVLSIAFPDLDTSGLTKLVEGKTNETIATLVPIQSSAQLVDYVKFKASGVDDANKQIRRFMGTATARANGLVFPEIPPLPFPRGEFPDTEKTTFRFLCELDDTVFNDEYYEKHFRAYFDRHYPAFNYWTLRTMVHLFGVNHYEETILESAFDWYVPKRHHPPGTSSEPKVLPEVDATLTTTDAMIALDTAQDKKDAFAQKVASRLEKLHQSVSVYDPTQDIGETTQNRLITNLEGIHKHVLKTEDPLLKSTLLDLINTLSDKIENFKPSAPVLTPLPPSEDEAVLLESSDEIEISEPNPAVMKLKTLVTPALSYFDPLPSTSTSSKTLLQEFEDVIISEIEDASVETTKPQLPPPSRMHFADVLKMSELAKADAEEALNGVQLQFDFSTLKFIASQLIGFIGSCVVCVTLFCSGKQVDFSTLSRNWSGIDFLGEKFSTVCEKLANAAGVKSESEKKCELVQEYIDKCNYYLQVPHTTYATRVDLRNALDKDCKEIETFLRMPLDPKIVDKTPLMSLYTALNNSRVTIHRAQYDNGLRVEPRMYIFCGEGGVGKTRTMQQLTFQIGRERYPELDLNRRSISITARGKYFPLLNGEPIWCVDEVGASTDYADELILRDVRGLCSPARFGADTAEIAGKNQTGAPHVIFCTTNTHPDDIISRISNLCGPESVEPSASRMIFIKAVRNVEKYGELDPANRDFADCDKTGKMDHVRYVFYKFNPNTKKYDEEKSKHTFQVVKNNVVQKMNILQDQFEETKRMMEGLTCQSGQSRMHFTVNLHGLPRGGKGKALDAIIPTLKQYTGYDVVHINSNMMELPPPVYSKRVIVVCDDAFSVDPRRRASQEKWWMDLYNQSLQAGSIIFVAMNIIPHKILPKIQILPSEISLHEINPILRSIIPFVTDRDVFPVPDVVASPQYHLQVTEPGFLRRIGLTGHFKNNTTSTTDLSLFVQHDAYYEQPRENDTFFITKYLPVYIIPILTLYFIPVLSIIVSLVYTAYVVYVINNFHVSVCDRSGLLNLVYSRYQKFLTTEKEVCVKFGVCNVPDEVVLRVKATNTQELINMNPLDLPARIFSSRQLYELAPYSWKICVAANAAPALMGYANRFLCARPESTVESVVDFVKALRVAMTTAGVDPSILVQLDDLGTFYLHGNTLTVDRRAGNNQDYNFCFLEGAFAICMDDRESVYPPVIIKWTTLAAHHINKEPLFEMEKMPLEHMKVIANALNDLRILSHPEYIKARAKIHDDNVMAHAKSSLVQFREKFTEFSSTMTGKICLGLVAALATIALAYTVYNCFKDDDSDSEIKPMKEARGKKRPVTKKKPKKNDPYDDLDQFDMPYSSEADSDLELEARGKKRPVTKKKPKKNDPYDDLDTYAELKQKYPELAWQKRDQIEKEMTSELFKQRWSRQMKRTNFKVSKPSPIVPTSVSELPDMNGYDGFKTVLGNLTATVAKNECWVVTSYETKDKIDFDTVEQRDAFLLDRSRCYGLFVNDMNLVTVGHIAEHCIKMNHNLYVAADQFGKTIYRASLVKSLASENRDLSFWTIEKRPSGISNFANIRKHFVKDFDAMAPHSDAILKRYAANKHEQFLYSSMMYEEDEIAGTTADGQPFSIKQFGFAWFSFCYLALTTYGDCGLPYFNVFQDKAAPEKGRQLKISGVHCMGNTQNSVAIGIVALVTQNDFRCFDNFKPEKVDCDKCGKEIRVEKPSQNDKSNDSLNKLHRIVWNSDHPSSVPNFFREVEYAEDFFGTNLAGLFRKSVSETIQTHPHSHTHVISNHYRGIELDSKYSYDCFVEEKVENFGLGLHSKFPVYSWRTLRKFFDNNLWIEEFVIWVDKRRIARNTKSGASRNVTKMIVEIHVTKYNLTDEEKKELTTKTSRQEITNLFIPSEYQPFVESYQEEPLDFDVPIPFNCDTVSLIGSLPLNASPLPESSFEQLPISNSLVSQKGKIPFNPNTDQAPEEQWEQVKISRFGQPCPRVTQSVQWQGKHFQPPYLVCKYVKEQYTLGLREFYANYRELSDEEVLRGPKGDQGLGRLELNKSAGFSLQQMFTVQLKSDILDVDELGAYHWLDNEASNFAHQWYKGCKDSVRNNIKPFFVYNELVKEEKLKPTKNFLGRIFCSADLVDIMIQRKFLGTFIMASTKFDQTVGVGSDPFVVFHNMALNCRTFGNSFTADYKRWDKTVPAWLFNTLGKSLDEINNTHVYSLMFENICNSIHASGYTLFQKHRGMPSGALVTANLNSKLNDLAFYSAFVSLGFKQGLLKRDLEYSQYNALVYRKFYGDDVIVSVHDDIKSWFNMTTTRKELSDLFGFVMDSSEKDGVIKDFMDWEELSWCSRYFRMLKNYRFFVGALKKATICSMLHFRKKKNDLLIFAAQLNVVLFEAAAWEEEFFQQVLGDIGKIRDCYPALNRFLLVMTYEEYQDDMYDQGMLGNLIRQTYALAQMFEVEMSDGSALTEAYYPRVVNFQVARAQPSSSTPIDSDLYLYPLFELLFAYRKHKFTAFVDMSIEVKIQSNGRDYVSLLNIMSQEGKISTPVYTFLQQPTLEWVATCTTKKESCDDLVTGIGIGTSKKMAKQQSAFEVYTKLFDSKARKAFLEQALKGMQKQMNLSGGDTVPTVKTTGMDVSLTAGSHVFSNTSFAQGVTDLNPTAFALNNIAQTGAPFDIKDSVYNIFQLEKSVTVSSTQSLGSEVFRLSLDPSARPTLHYQYISMHEAHCPSVEFGVYVNGAAGALGTLKIGFVRDISKKSFSLADIQQIACQEVSLGQSSTVSFLVRDIRRKNLYRKVQDDDEPYPGVVALVSNPITNVQRNDSVAYPIQIYSRLNKEYILAVPTAIDGINTIGTEINLGSYFELFQFDMAINNNLIVDTVANTVSFPECGWNTGKFDPTFTKDNMAAIGIRRPDTFPSDAVAVCCRDNGAGRKPITYAQIYESLKEYVGAESFDNQRPTFPPYMVAFAYGQVPEKFNATWQNLFYMYYNDKGHFLSDLNAGGTQYTITKFEIDINDYTFDMENLIVFDKGCLLVGFTNQFEEPYIDNLNLAVVYPKIDSKISIEARGFTIGHQITANITDIQPNTVFWDYSKELWRAGIPIPYDTDYRFDSSGYLNRDHLFFQTNALGKHVSRDFALASAFGSGVNNMSSMYTWSYLATANASSTSAAPTGLSRLCFLRPGTSLASAISVNPVNVPGYFTLCKALNGLMTSLKADWLELNFYSDALLSDFQLVYRNNIFLVRNPNFNLIRTSMSPDDCLLKDIKAIVSPTSVSPMTTPSYWSNWITSSTRMLSKLALRGASYEMFSTGAMMIGGAIGGLAQAQQAMWQQNEMNKNYQLNRDLAVTLQNLKGQQQQDLAQKQFDLKLQMMGLSSVSVASGNSRTNLPGSRKALDNSPKEETNRSARFQNDEIENSHYGPNNSAIRSAAGLSPEGSADEIAQGSNLNPNAAEFVPSTPTSSGGSVAQAPETSLSTGSSSPLSGPELNATALHSGSSGQATSSMASPSSSEEIEMQTFKSNDTDNRLGGTRSVKDVGETSYQSARNDVQQIYGTKYPLARGSIVPNARFPSASNSFEMQPMGASRSGPGESYV